MLEKDGVEMQAYAYPPPYCKIYLLTCRTRKNIYFPNYSKKIVIAVKFILVTSWIIENRMFIINYYKYVQQHI